MKFRDCGDPYPSLASGLRLTRHGLSMGLCPLSVAVCHAIWQTLWFPFFSSILPHFKFSLLYLLETCLLPSISIWCKNCSVSITEGYDCILWHVYVTGNWLLATLFMRAGTSAGLDWCSVGPWPPWPPPIGAITEACCTILHQSQSSVVIWRGLRVPSD